MQAFLKTIADGGTLSTEQSEQAMHLMMRGEAAPEEVAGFLMGLRARGETVDELVGFTRVMREYAVKVSLDDPYAIDLCGTGGVPQWISGRAGSTGCKRSAEEAGR